MTVAELIKELEKHPPKQRVMFARNETTIPDDIKCVKTDTQQYDPVYKITRTVIIGKV